MSSFTSSSYIGCALSKIEQRIHPVAYPTEFRQCKELLYEKQNPAHECKVFLESEPQHREGNVEQKGLNA